MGKEWRNGIVEMPIVNILLCVRCAQAQKIPPCSSNACTTRTIIDVCVGVNSSLKKVEIEIKISIALL